jgi:hypothetical protein
VVPYQVLVLLVPIGKGGLRLAIYPHIASHHHYPGRGKTAKILVLVADAFGPEMVQMQLQLEAVHIKLYPSVCASPAHFKMEFSIFNNLVLAC